MTPFVLLCLGIAMVHGLLHALDWRGVAVGVTVILVIRPLMGVLSLLPFASQSDGMDPRERLVAAFLGVRGISRRSASPTQLDRLTSLTCARSGRLSLSRSGSRCRCMGCWRSQLWRGSNV